MRLIKDGYCDFFVRTIHSVLPCSFGQPLNVVKRLEKVNVALVSRDVTGASIKHRILPPLAIFNSLLLSAGNLEWVHAHSAGHSPGNYERALNVFPGNVQLWAEGEALSSLAL